MNEIPASKAPPTVTQAPLPLAARLTVFLSTHHYYGWKDIRTEVFDGNTDAFIDTWASGALPHDLAQACENTIDVAWLQVFLLRRVSRQLSALLAALG